MIESRHSDSIGRNNLTREISLNRILFIVILLIPLSISAQTRRPTLLRSDQSEEERKQPSKSRNEGRRIHSIDFRGNQNISTATIRKFMLVQEGDEFDRERLAADLDRLRVLLLGSKGYLKARFDEPRIEETIGGVDIALTVREGTRSRWGEIAIIGSTLISYDEAKKLVGFESGVVADGFRLQNGLSKLSMFYIDHGYFRVNVAIVPEFKSSYPETTEDVVDVTLDIDEGQLFRINRITFEGNVIATDQIIRRQLLIHEGDVYSKSLLRKSVEAVNSLELLEEIEDVSIKVTDDGGLDIKLRIKEKEHR